MNGALVVGASGFIGRALLAALGDGAVGTHHRRPWPGSIPFDATADTLADLLDRAGGHVERLYLVHGAVNPETCAQDPVGTAAINVTGVKRLVSDAIARGIFPIFISSDYVYDGTRGGRSEADPPTPSTEYGRQKAEVERWMADLGAPCLVARLSKVVGDAEDAHSVLGELLPEIRRGATLRMATDQVFSPAHVDDIARALAELPQRGARGVVNVAGPVAWSRYDLIACLLSAIRRRDPATAATLRSCSLHDLPFRERRPLDTSLDTTRLRSFLPWQFRSMEEVCERIAEAAFDPARMKG
jgi:dTDP-4-dehydrorhamnose reductase